MGTIRIKINGDVTKEIFCQNIKCGKLTKYSYYRDDLDNKTYCIPCVESGDQLEVKEEFEPSALIWLTKDVNMFEEVIFQ